MCKAEQSLRNGFAVKLKRRGPRFLRKIDLWIDQWWQAVPLEHKLPRSPKLWRLDSDKLKRWAVKPNPKFKGPGCRLLGGFSANGPRPAKMIFATPYTRLNQHTALTMWKKIIMPALKKHYPGRATFLVQQDGDRSLNANAVVNALSEMGVTIAFRGGASGPQAPARMCEFWPVETVWANRSTAVRKMVQKSKKWSKGFAGTVKKRTLKSWEAAVLGVVRRVGSSFLQALHDGMPKRLKRLLDAKGGPIGK